MRRLLVPAAALLVAGCSVLSMPNRPATPDEAKAGDELAARMVQAMGGMDAFKRLRLISFDFRATALGYTFRERHHDWDPWANVSRYVDGDTTVFLRLGDRTGVVYRAGQLVTDEKERADALEEAFAAWTNDHYWLISPYKVFDPGARRAVVDGELRISFEEAVGLTPGDVYFYKLDERFVPTGWRFRLQTGLRQEYTFDKPRTLEGVLFFEEKTNPLAVNYFDNLKVSTVEDQALFAPLR